MEGKVTSITSIQNLNCVDPPLQESLQSMTPQLDRQEQVRQFLAFSQSAPFLQNLNDNPQSINDPFVIPINDQNTSIDSNGVIGDSINDVRLSNGNNSATNKKKKKRKTSQTKTNGHSSNGDRNNPPERELVDLVTCKVCKGYLIDAVTLDTCMHSFCKACAIKCIRNQPKCPECNQEIKENRSLRRLKTDTALQSVVYKLVPGLYEREMAQRRTFYASRPSPTLRFQSEMFGDIPAAKTISPDDKITVGLTLKDDSEDEQIKTYFSCRADTNMILLKKLIIAKYGLERSIKIYYGTTEVRFDMSSLMDLAVMFNWLPDDKVLDLSFCEVQDEDGRENQSNDKLTTKVSTSSSSHQNSDPFPSTGL